MALEGNTAIVTGGAQGIGRAIVERFLSDGARVVIADVDEAKAQQALKELSAQGELHFVKTDISKKSDVDNLMAIALDKLGGSIGILVNNAGIVHGADFLDLHEDDFERVLNINLKGAFLAGQAVARVMVEQVSQGGAPGAIINVSSINAVVAIPDQVPYCVSKGGLAQLTRVMSLALAPHGIRVNAIGPGSIMTELLAAVNENEEARARIMSRTPLGRIGEAAEIAAIAAFLASSEASYVTGQTIYADGGRLPLNYTVAARPKAD